MLKEINWSNSRSYRTGRKNEPLEFYLNALSKSNQFDLLLGYFSSSAINLLSLGFAKFLYNNGNVKIIINNILSETDKNIIETGLKSDSSIVFDLSNIELIKQTLDEYGTHFFECIAWLISQNKIEFKIIKPKNKKGISHYKSGIFSDNNNRIGFKGSCNFTANGLLENLEELDIFLSWENSRSTKWIDDEKQYFDEIFTENADFVEYLNIQDIQTAIYNEFGDKNINELLIQEKELIEKKKIVFNKNIRILEIMEQLESEINNILKEPKFPFPSGAREYQNEAYVNWKNNKQQGLFAMATGTGKTITSLNCLLEIYKKTGYYKALIVVPTITLIKQWESECHYFNFTKIFKVYSKNPHWKNEIEGILLQERLLSTDQVSYIIITTYASFSRQNIFFELNQLSAKTLFIADECHNLGAIAMQKLLPKINCKRRIGLSATPERQFDEEGNLKLFSFFNSENGYTFEYSMQEAINRGVLCRYYYYPHLVSLTDSEMKDYLELSLKISKFYNSNSDSFKNDSILTALLLSRKRIIHKAFNKVNVFCDILNEQYKKKRNLKYTLVYVPEGNDPSDYFETDLYSNFDEIETDRDAVHLIDVFTKAVRDIDNRITVKQFISGIAERDEILKQFAKGDIDVLTSMKCLDEGVDVPRAELAIFCASTGNPRQFVQRRGRILRRHNDKQFAYIHDLVVIPQVKPNSDSYKMERSMLKKELERVNNFALLSENSSHTVDVLLDTMNYYNLNLYHND